MSTVFQSFIRPFYLYLPQEVFTLIPQTFENQCKAKPCSKLDYRVLFYFCRGPQPQPFIVQYIVMNVGHADVKIMIRIRIRGYARFRP